MTVTVSAPSGQNCTIAALASGRVDQLHGAIERSLKIPRVVQRLIFAGREIYSGEFLAELQLANGSDITVINSWPQTPVAIVEKLHLAASASATHTLAAAVSQCLQHEDCSVKVAALNTLSWMGRLAAPHAGAIASLLRDNERGVCAAAAELLSWLEEAAYAVDVLAFGFRPPVGQFGNAEIMGKARQALTVLLESESSSIRLTALKSLIGLMEDTDKPAAQEQLQRRRFLLPHVGRLFSIPPKMCG